ncbi:MAG: pyruvate formate lyase family protein, partial [Anaerolineales bacterium]
MRSIVIQARERLLTAPETICLERAELVTEAYKRYADAPLPIRRAKALDHILGHMTLDLESNPILAGNTSSTPRAWMLLPEYGFSVPGQALVEHPWFSGMLAGDAIPDSLRDFWRDRATNTGSSIGHLTIDNGRLLSKGLNDVITEAESYDDDGSEAAIYRRACAIACRAVIHWAQRYASAAERAAEATTDPIRAAALRRVATACHHVPANPARNLFEALQAMILAHLAVHIEGHGYSVSPGRLDQLLWPYYHGDQD